MTTKALTIITGDCRTALRELPEQSVQCCVTSPPYWGLRDYGHADQIGQESTPDAYVQTMCDVFAEVWRVLRDDGTLWLNLGDSYSRSSAKGGSGPNGKNENRWGYGLAQSAKQGSSDGMVGHGDRPGTRAGDEGLNPKNLLGIPWRVAFALQAAGWYLRSDIIWHKPNPMPESVADRPTKSHEYIFLLTKQGRYFYDAAAIREPASYGEEHANKATSWGTNRKHPNKNNVSKYAHTGDNNTCYKNGDGVFERNKRSVWTVTTSPYRDAHFATFPPDLIKPCILAGTKPGDVVLDPFGGSGTTGMVALELGRRAVLIELNPDYVKLMEQRTNVTQGMAL